jgi:hypothetical protein
MEQKLILFNHASWLLILNVIRIWTNVMSNNFLMNPYKMLSRQKF